MLKFPTVRGCNSTILALTYIGNIRRQRLPDFDFYSKMDKMVSIMI